MSRESIKSVYERLNSHYDLKLTNTFALENGHDDFREDFELLCGASSVGKFMLWHDGVQFIFDVDKKDGTYTHWHPANIDDAVNDVKLFMEGYCKA